MQTAEVEKDACLPKTSRVMSLQRQVASTILISGGDFVNKQSTSDIIQIATEKANRLFLNSIEKCGIGVQLRLPEINLGTGKGDGASKALGQIM